MVLDGRTNEEVSSRGQGAGPRRMNAEYRGGHSLDGQVIDHGWPDLPAPIVAKPAAPESYPVDVFPRELAEVIPAVQRLAQCPAAVTGAALLGALALLVQHDWRVRTLAPHPSPAGLYLMAIAGSGLHKTTAFGLMSAGHHEADVRLQARWKAAVQRRAVKEECEETVLRSSLPVALLSEFTTDGMLRQLQGGRPAVASWEAEAGALVNQSFRGTRSPRTMGYLNKAWESGALLKTLADEDGGIFVPADSYALSIVWGGAPDVMLPVIFGRDAAHGFTARCLVLFSVNYFCRFRRLFLPVHLLFPTPLLGHSGAVAGHVEFQDDRVVDHPVDGRGRGHGVGEDVFPLGEDQVGRDAHGPAFVAFGDEREEHLGLLRALGQVSQVVQQQEVVVVELS